MKSCICSVVALLSMLAVQSQVQAALFINSVASIASQTATTATVNVSLYGLKAATPAIELVSTFGVRVTVNSVTPTSITGITSAPGTSEWSAFNNVPAPTTTANSVTFRAYRSPDGLYANITGTTVGASTLIGTFSFTVNKTASAQSFTTSASADTAITGAGVQGNGPLFFNNVLVFESITTSYNTDPVTLNAAPGSGTIAAITAVPEPSSLALLGLVSAGGYIARRRRAAKVS